MEVGKLPWPEIHAAAAHGDGSSPAPRRGGSQDLGQDCDQEDSVRLRLHAQLLSPVPRPHPDDETVKIKALAQGAWSPARSSHLEGVEVAFGGGTYVVDQGQGHRGRTQL